MRTKRTKQYLVEMNEDTIATYVDCIEYHNTLIIVEKEDIDENGDQYSAIIYIESDNEFHEFEGTGLFATIEDVIDYAMTIVQRDLFESDLFSMDTRLKKLELNLTPRDLLNEYDYSYQDNVATLDYKDDISVDINMPFEENDLDDFEMFVFLRSGKGDYTPLTIYAETLDEAIELVRDLTLEDLKSELSIEA